MQLLFFPNPPSIRQPSPTRHYPCDAAANIVHWDGLCFTIGTSTHRGIIYQVCHYFRSIGVLCDSKWRAGERSRRRPRRGQRDSRHTYACHAPEWDMGCGMSCVETRRSLVAGCSSRNTRNNLKRSHPVGNAVRGLNIWRHFSSSIRFSTHKKGW